MRKKTLYTIFFVIIVCYLVWAPQTIAADWNFVISPPIYRIIGLNSSHIHLPLFIENRGDDDHILSISLKAFTAAGDTGSVRYIPLSDLTTHQYPKLFNQLVITESGQAVTRLELAPHEKKIVYLESGNLEKIMADYSFSVVFQETPQTLVVGKSATQTLPAIAANVLLSLGPRVPAHAQIETFETPLIRQQGPVPFTVRVRNTGEQIISPQGVIDIKNMFGQHVGEIPLPPAYILPQTTRVLADSGTNVTKSSESSQNNGNDYRVALWKEKFLFGPYTATVRLKMSDVGPIMEQSQVFLAFPWQTMAAGGISLVLVTIFFIKVKRRLQEI